MTRLPSHIINKEPQLMADNETLSLELKIHNIDSFKDLVEALGAWVDEAHKKENMTPAEQALLKAAADLAGETED